MNPPKLGVCPVGSDLIKSGREPARLESLFPTACTVLQIQSFSANLQLDRDGVETAGQEWKGERC